MKNYFNKLSFKNKIVLLMVAIGVSSLLIFISIFLSFDRKQAHQHFTAEVRQDAALIVKNIQAALTFEDKDSAQQILQSLQNKKDILYVSILYSDFSEFVDYKRSDLKLSDKHYHEDLSKRKKELLNRVVTNDDNIEFLEAIVLNKKNIGYIYIRGSLESIERRTEEILYFSALLLIVMIVWIFILSQSLQKLITDPIFKLTSFAKKVSKDKDYSKKIEIITSDEVGILMNAFNDMLEQIDIQDKNIKSSNLKLEAIVDLRTQELRKKVDEARKLNQELRETQDQLLQSQKLEAIGKLAGGIAHDFNNFIGGILGYASLLKRKLKDQPQYLRQIEMIIKSSERASELTKQLLGFARKGQYQKVPFNINDIVLEARNLIYRSIDKTINLDLQLEEGLGFIEGDPTQMMQVLMNLSINARDAMPDGGTLVIKTESLEFRPEEKESHMKMTPGKYVKLTIADSGTGITGDVQNKIFDPFFTTKEIGKGTGLGLSMVYGIVENHKGFLEFDTVLGKGTSFYIYLPVFNGDKNEIKMGSTSERNTDKEKIFLENKKILVVDDEFAMRDVLFEFLQEHGSNVSLAASGKEALEMIHKNTFDMMIFDVTMPDMDGITLFEEMKKIVANPKVLFTSGYSRSEKLQNFLEEQNVRYISKPYSLEKLISELSQIIS